MGTLFQSPLGDVSSKRVLGAALLALGVFATLFGGFTVNTLLVEVGNTYLYTGGALVGLGVVDHFGKVGGV